MKNRYLKLMTVIIAVLCLSMTACGSNRESGAVREEEQISESMDTAVVSADTESGNAQSEDEKEPATVSESSDESNGTEATGDSASSLEAYLTNPDDALYFVPETDDWLITVATRNDYDPAETHISLYSFDASGMLVQYIDRRTNSDGSEVRTLPSGPNDAKSSDNKAEYMTSFDGYFSQPYLTDSQIRCCTLME